MLFILRADKRRVGDFPVRKNFVRAFEAIFGLDSEFFDRFCSRFGIHVGYGDEFRVFVIQSVAAEKLTAAAEADEKETVEAK